MNMDIVLSGEQFPGVVTDYLDSLRERDNNVEFMLTLSPKKPTRIATCYDTLARGFLEVISQ
jgi:hypothetical protein